MTLSLPARLVLIVSIVCAPPASAQGTPVGFEEDFALALDREAALEQLIPGTPDYYFYHCLHRQNAGDLDGVEPLLALWIDRHGRTPRVEEIENRQALLRFDGDPAATYEFLRQRLGLRFDHRRPAGGEAPDLPARLEPALVSRETWTRLALRSHPGSLDGFRASGLDRLVGAELDDALLRDLLNRLQRPDLPNLPALVVRELEERKSRGFGSLAIHGRLLLDQLEACAALRPQLLNESAFVESYLRRLHPGADVQWRRDAVGRLAYLERLQAFAQRLTPSHNSLKAHVLHHRLVHDLAAGAPDKGRFLAYLRLPRPSPHVNPRYLERRGRGDELVDLGRAFPTGLQPIGSDDRVVRAYLAHFLGDEDDYEAYAEFLRGDYVKRLFAETKILAGVGDMERWYSLLDDPAYYDALKERVEIEFPPTQRTHFANDDAVSIEVDLKNVQTLLVKVFEVNALNYYVAEQREVDASINVDGLVANEETTHTYDVNPLRRVRRRFEFPGLAEPGVYVVEFIGNGLASRAVIRKGRLQYTERVGAAGHVFRVLDEAGRQVPDGSIRLAGREYVADERGEVLVPFSTDPGEKTIVLRGGGLASLDRFEHAAESYDLEVGIFVDREALIAGQNATLVIRPSLLVNRRVASLELLEDVVLAIESRDQSGVASTLMVRDLELFSDRESTHEILVPERLAELRVSLRGSVQNLSQGESVELASETKVFTLNEIEATEHTASPLLGRADGGYVLDVLGKNGEPRPELPVSLRFRHEDFTDPVDVQLKTDSAGRIELGALDGIRSVHASGFPDGYGDWWLRPAARSYPRVLHGGTGRTLSVPYLGRESSATRAAVSLIELRDGVFARDRRAHVSLVDGFLELRDLPAGDYDLWLPESGKRINVRITGGAAEAGWARGRDRLLEIDDAALLHLTEVTAEGDELVVRLANVGSDARVHLHASRYLAPYDAFAELAAPYTPSAVEVPVNHLDSSYHSGREIGDEYRYILERRFVAKYPGNMLQRPALLLNPWALDDTHSMIGIGGGAGGKFGGRSGGRKKMRAAGGAGASERSGRTPGIFPSLEFLGTAPIVLANLRPDAGGVVRVPLADLGPGQLVHVLALDEESSTYASLALAETPLAATDQRLSPALDPARHLTEQRRIEFVGTDATAVIEDVTTSDAETYDTLASVYQLYRTLSGDDELANFAFLVRWPELTDEERRTLYSEHACHELHFFLHEKDPAFFEAVVRPYLANKVHRTLLDDWLLDADLAPYLDPWAFGRLNVVERILLTRRLEGRAAGGARHVRELFETMPRDPAGEAVAFATALERAALDTAGGVGGRLADLRKSLEPRRSGGGGAAAPSGPSTPGPATPGARSREVRPTEGLVPPEDEADTEELEAVVAGEFFDDGVAADKSIDRDADLDRRQITRSLYRGVGPTRAYVEQNYWRRRIDEHDASLVGVNAFWLDFADADPATPFVSTNFPAAAGNVTEMLLALAVLDLPFTADEHGFETDGPRATIRAASPLLLVRRDLAPAAVPDERSPILISQNLFRLDDRYLYEAGERRDKFVSDELLTDVAYGCQVVVTNPTSAPTEVELLLQIPQGALPVSSTRATHGRATRVGAYGTAAFEYAFYFPAAGTYTHYPAHAGRDGELLAFAEPASLRVVDEPTEIDSGSWEHLSRAGSLDQVLAYMEGSNLRRVDLSKILWRLRDREAFRVLVERLRERHVYDRQVWSYGVHHADARAASELLRGEYDFLGRCGRWLSSPLATIDPVERRSYQHVEFFPLVNGRAHRFRDRREILNQDLARQYLDLLDALAYRPVLDDGDWMSVTYYLLLQDRVEEALASFARIDAEELPARLQYDYMRSYMDFYSDAPGAARAIAEAYRDYPVPRWRTLFEEVERQLDEAEGRAVAGAEGEDRETRQAQLVATEPALALEVEARQVRLGYRNLERCEVSYYRMDIEFLFSTSPFVQHGSSSFSYIRPNRRDVLPLAADSSQVAFDLPAEFQSDNVLVEVRAGGIVRRQAYYANSLAVSTIESYGQLRVTHAETTRPLPKVYVKVYARLPGGAVQFHKDGYTDLRGRFDYVSLSGEANANAERYAVLVMSERDGAVIQEVEPPLR